MRVVVGQGSCGIAAGAGKVYNALASLRANPSDFSLETTGCIGMCFLEPIVDLYEGEDLKARLVHVAEGDAEKIVNAVLQNNLEELKPMMISDDDASFLSQQTRIALRNCGIIDPTDINSYKAKDGYKALEKVLKTMTPEEVIEEIKVSGLAGRGGAGFPTWFKWNAARGSEGDEKYLICNADEGDPGAFMDRAVIGADPD